MAEESLEERFALENLLKTLGNNWIHQKLRSIPIPKKDARTRMLKIPGVAESKYESCDRLKKSGRSAPAVHRHHT
ncbi:hypothetical protein [Tolypothrix sp. VBCCA 56010]|uniref:hypothetical protein n=1 Tax=Tolypothrix sp. VBCCA 56010 TaxID=3137731 RepID=UPI003D7CD2A9